MSISGLNGRIRRKYRQSRECAEPNRLIAIICLTYWDQLFVSFKNECTFVF